MKKRILKTAGITLGVLLLVGMGFVWYVYFSLGDISESHVEENLPNNDVFEQYLLRDISAYFTERYNGNIEVSYELLRGTGDQAGLGVPKFYLWVVITDSVTNEEIDKGTVRVGANNKESFTVMNYLSVEDIKQKPDGLSDAFFPSDIIGIVKSKIQECNNRE